MKWGGDGGEVGRGGRSSYLLRMTTFHYAKYLIYNLSKYDTTCI